MIWLEVRLEVKSILLAGVYREWRNSEGKGDLASQKERFLVILKQIESASCLGRPVVIAGDWNLDHNKFDDEMYRLRCLVQDLTLIKKSCRLECSDIRNTFIYRRSVDGEMTTLQSSLDQVYHSQDGIEVGCYTIPSGMSYHIPTVAEVKGKTFRQRAEWRTITKRSYEKIHFRSLAHFRRRHKDRDFRPNEIYLGFTRFR